MVIVRLYWSSLVACCCAAWDHQMQSGVKKREELHEKYQEKFKELGVSSDSYSSAKIRRFVAYSEFVFRTVS